MTVPIRLKATSSSLSGVVNTNIGTVVTPPIEPPTGLIDRWAPQYTLPTFMVWNPTARKCELTPEKEAWCARANKLPGTSQFIADSGNPVTNYNNLAAAYAAAKNRSGSRHIRLGVGVNARFITSQPLTLDWNMVDGNGVQEYLVIEAVTIGTGLLGDEDRRVGPDDNANLAKVEVWNQYAAQPFEVTENTNSVRFGGIYWRMNPDTLAALRASRFGQPLSRGPGGDTFSFVGMVGYDALAPHPTIPNAAIRRAGNPRNIQMDRCVIQGDDGVRFRRLILAHFSGWLMNSCYAECRGDIGNDDSQVIGATTVSGDWVIRNCDLWGGQGENFIFGGGMTWGSQYMLRDTCWINNRIGTLDRWGPSGYDDIHKNLWELKCGERHFFGYNHLGPYWGYNRFTGQRYSVVVKTTDQNSFEPWCVTRDVNIIGNLLADCSGGFNIIGKDNTASRPILSSTHRICIRGNAMLPMANVMAADSQPIDSPKTLRWQEGGFAITSGYTDVVDGSETNSYVRDVDFRYNSIAGASNPATVEDYSFLVGVSTVNTQNPPIALRWKVDDNLLWARDVASNAWWYAEVAGTFGFLPNSWNAWTKTNTTTERNLVVGVTDGARDVTGPFGATNLAFATPAAAGVNASTLVLTSGPGLTLAEDGGPAGVDWATFNSLTARSRTGRN